MANKLPDGFLWGVATSAYQIEGAVREDGRGASVWDTFSHTPGKTFNGDTGDVATDHYHRLEQDLDLMAELGITAYRFSIAWPRIQPAGSGRPNAPGLAFYERLVDGLLARSIAPVATLYHWDLPQALEDRGGWPNRETALRFADYAAVTARRLGDRVAYWITHNEPWVAAWLGYADGLFAPGHTDLREAAAAQHHMLLSHGLAVEAIRSEAAKSDAQIGIALNLHDVTPASDEDADVAAADWVYGQQAASFLEPLFAGHYPDGVEPMSSTWADPELVRPGDLEVIGRPIDFLGVNYYHPRFVASPDHLVDLVHEGFVQTAPDHSHSFGFDFVELAHAEAARTEMGWPVEPDGLTRLLLRLRAEYPKVPVIVTENGAAFADRPDASGRVADPRRVAYLEGHIGALTDAAGQGVDVRGYFVWSLLDNFEWSSGYSKRFGLVYVDFPTGRRRPKDSYRWYREFIASGG